MKSLKVRFSDYITESREVKITRENKFKVVIEYSEDVISDLEVYNLPRIGNNESGDWIVFDVLHKNYEIVDNSEGDVIEDKNGTLFFAMHDNSESTYRLIDENKLQSLLEGL